MKPVVITLTGPSGAGKSTLVRSFLKCSSGKFAPVLIPKFTTRLPRDDDGREVICVNTEEGDDHPLPPECDIIYEQNRQRYGLPSSSLFSEVRKGCSPLVILNDVRAIEDVRSTFGPMVRSVFVFREGPSLIRMEELAEERGVKDRLDARRRLTKSRAIYRIYIENIHLFEYVVVNAGPVDNAERQVKAIVESIFAAEDWPLNGDSV